MNTYTPLEYLQIDAANQYGHDKKSFPQRIAWFKKLKDPRSKIMQAEKPAQFAAAVLAHEDALNGVPSGHLVGMDACASGITILGILAGCHTTAGNTGITGTKRMDMYHECTQEMNSILGGQLQIPRAEVKGAQMTHFYGSKAEPKKVFGEDTYELMAFYEAQEKVAPGACYVMRELLASWQSYALEHTHNLPDGFVSRVPVLQKMKAKIEIDELAHATLTYIFEDNVGMEKGLAVAANITHAIDAFIVRELVRRCNFDRKELMATLSILKANRKTPPAMNHHNIPRIEHMARRHGFVSLRGAEFITADTVLDFSLEYREELSDLIEEVLSGKSFEVVTIHDEFKCHPNHMNELRENYMFILAELADSRVGEEIIQQVRKDPNFVLQKLSTDLGTEIMKGEYQLS